MTDTAAPDDPRPTVLVFEDKALIAMLVEDLLANAGYRAVRALDAGGVLSVPDSAAIPCAAVVDLRLARSLDGRDVLRRLREQHPEMPVVVVTGYDPLAPEADLRGLGGPTVRMRKPFECDALLEYLADVLGGTAKPAAPRRRASDTRRWPRVGAAPVAP